MALPTFTLPADPNSGAPAGTYVPADTALSLEQTLSKLVWQVLYGKSYDATGMAAQAEEMLRKLSLTTAH